MSDTAMFWLGFGSGIVFMFAALLVLALVGAHWLNKVESRGTEEAE